MMNKNELIEKIREFMVSPKNILLFDAYGTQEMVKLLLKVIINDVKTPTTIGFLSTHQAHFGEVFSKNSSSIKTETEYVLGGHKIKFFIYDKSMIKDPPKGLSYLLIYPIENIKDKELVKLCNSLGGSTRSILVIQKSNDSFKHIKKLSPFEISVKGTPDSNYYNLVKSTVYRK